MAKQRVKITPRKLRRLYYAEHRSATDVAEMFGCSPTTIKNYLVKYDWRVKRQSEIMKGRKLSEGHRNKVVLTLRQNLGDKV